MVEYNASSWWTVGDAVLYYQANLDPNKKHTISLINQRYDSSTSTIGLNTITVFGFQGSKVYVIALVEALDCCLLFLPQ